MAPILADDKICSQESNWQQTSIGSGNGLALNRRQAITWTNADPVRLRIHVAPGGDDLMQKRCNSSVLAME